jgi:DNA-binding transcriptional regulator YbjK
MVLNKKRVRMPPEQRKALILQALVQVAAKHHYNNITRRDIADQAGVADSLVPYYIGSMEDIDDLLMSLVTDKNSGVATQAERMTVLAQGLASKHPVAQSASMKLKREALRFIS